MSWQAGILVLLFLTILGGFAWYERSRPPSQIVALVAALAALAVAGRVAFSPIPNVVPSTDIILIAGYALGGAPGFAVGALTGLVSNFWLGQGPWTPWQMAGWGMVGVLGAGLGALTGGRIGRLSLALACAFCGLAYGALLDVSLMVTYGGEQSLDRFLVLSARGLPFNVAHAAGNFTLALVAGPAMVRMLQRYRSRFEFAWAGDGRSRAGRTATAGAACVLLVLAAALSAAQDPGARAANRAPGAAATSDATANAAGISRSGKQLRGERLAVAWLRSAQNSDGGFGFGRDVGSSTAITAWASLGLEAAGISPRDLAKGGATPITYLRSNASAIRTAADIERTVLVLEAAGLDSRSFAGRDLIARLRKQRGADGSWDAGQVNPTAFGVLALEAAGTTSSSGRTASWLAASQNRDGGWGFAPGTGSDADTTGAVLQALSAAGGHGAAIRRGVAFLRTIQRRGGGFPLSGGAPNAQSTAWAVQGLLAAGTSPSSVRTGGRSPLDYIASVQARDGHYRYSAATDQTPVWVTAQALMAVESMPFPFAEISSGSSGGGGSGRSGASGGGSSGAGAAAGGAKASGGGSPDAQAAAGGTPAVAAVAPETSPARFESDGGDPDRTPLFAAIGVGLLIIAGAVYVLQRQSAGR
jgi:Prenyltransferase and squalene oxidase repeat